MSILSASDIEAVCSMLEGISLDEETARNFYLSTWTTLLDRDRESQSLLELTAEQHGDADSRARYENYLSGAHLSALIVDYCLGTRLLKSPVIPQRFEEPMRRIQDDQTIFHEENLPLLVQVWKIERDYVQAMRIRTVDVQGTPYLPHQLRTIYSTAGNRQRALAWRSEAQRGIADRETLHGWWTKLLCLRTTLAENAGFPDYRSYRWRQLHLSEYRPEDSRRLHAAIEEFVVPVITRLHDRRRRSLGLRTVRPWDLHIDPLGRPALRPFVHPDDLLSGAVHLVKGILPQSDEYVDMMLHEGWIDVGLSRNAAPEGYFFPLPFSRQSRILLDVCGLPQDIDHLLHHIGFAVQAFATSSLPYEHQRQADSVFGETVACGVELLAEQRVVAHGSPFYDPTDVSRACAGHLERFVMGWVRTAMSDAFQHWAYLHPADASDSDACAEMWSALWLRFLPSVNWTGLEHELASEWYERRSIFLDPFTDSARTLGQMFAVRLLEHAGSDLTDASARLWNAMAEGTAVGLSRRIETAGLGFEFDEHVVREAAHFLEDRIAALDPE